MVKKKMKINDLSIIVGGQAGDGITQAGINIGLACMRGGLHAFGTNDYQSLIRGGHNFYIIRVNKEKIYSQMDYADLLLALNQETITLHKDELNPGAGIIYDGDEIKLKPEEFEKAGFKLFPVPLGKIVRDLKGQSIVRNSVITGAALALVNYDLDVLLGVIRDSFEGKEQVANLNMEAARQGFNYVQEHFKDKFDIKLEKASEAPGDKMLLTGIEATGLGAIKAGCRFYAGYPMTPTTPLLQFMASMQKEYNMLVIQTESEIAAITMIAGASFAGARAMTATSGGGFCLMSEGLGMAAMTETPVVIVLGQRPGPSTGLPTYSSQGDLRFAMHAGQGEFPRVVVASGDVEQCFVNIQEAFNLAEKFQVPVIMIADKYLLESHKSTPFFDQSKVAVDRCQLIMDEYTGTEEYKRYKLTESGISLRAVPLTKGAIVRANSDEHTELGYTAEEPELTIEMNDKRFRKLEGIREDLENYETISMYGPEKADVTIIGWGGTKGPILEAMKLLEKDGVKANYLQIIYVMPFPEAKVRNVLESAKKTVMVENNKTGLMAQVIREKTKIDVNHIILKYDGRPFNPISLAKQIKEVL
jgi:2-oxoglutarate ferredoxin oxidoreductase subunit alpha